MESFDELKISAPIAKAIQELGYTIPSPIQKEALPILLGEPTDFIGLAATGTGKTAAFGIPLLEQIDPTKKHVQGLIMCPTRELALQVTGQINLMGKHRGIRALPIYGGSGYVDQLQGLKHGATIVVGTPGRLIDHLTRGTLKLDNVKTMILDEADEMISMGFKEDLEALLKATPRPTAKIWLFSATMSREVRRVADTYLKSPKQVQVNRTEVLSNTVEQIYYAVKESDKPEVLGRILEMAEDFYGLIFCQTKMLVTDLTAYLIERGFKVDCLHGDKDQKSREKTMQSFRDRRVHILICTDVASRGLDVKDLTHVVNYSLPREADVYVHRIGRTARSGKSGLAVNLVTASHRGLIGRIENFTKSKMKEGRVPSYRDLGGKKLTSILSKFNDQKYFDRAVALMSDEWKAAIATMTPEEIVARFLTLTAPELFGQGDKIKLQTSVAPEASQRPPQNRSRSYSRDRDAGGGRDRRDRGHYEKRSSAGGEFSRGARPDKLSDTRPERRSDKPRFEKSESGAPRSSENRRPKGGPHTGTGEFRRREGGVTRTGGKEFRRGERSSRGEGGFSRRGSGDSRARA